MRPAQGTWHDVAPSSAAWSSVSSELSELEHEVLCDHPNLLLSVAELAKTRRQGVLPLSGLWHTLVVDPSATKCGHTEAALCDLHMPSSKSSFVAIVYVATSLACCLLLLGAAPIRLGYVHVGRDHFWRKPLAVGSLAVRLCGAGYGPVVNPSWTLTLQPMR